MTWDCSEKVSTAEQSQFRNPALIRANDQRAPLRFIGGGFNLAVTVFDDQ